MQINGKVLCDYCLEETAKTPCPLCGYREGMFEQEAGVLPLGAVLKERYHIGKMLGKGGFGITYKAYDDKENRMVAVKEYYPSGMAHRDTGTTQVSVGNKTLAPDFQSGAEKFCEEAKTISRFNGNPNIVSVYDSFQENGTAYFIMEYLDGMDLKHYIRLHGGKLTQENVVHIAKAVSDALMITHSMNVLHRDISPDNIYITSDGQIKLIDFGAARQVMSEQSKSMSVILKQGFAPLEQYQRKGKQGSWTDIYALGATMYYALTGKIPDDATERLEEPEIGRAEDYGVDPELWAVIDKCMAIKISDRYGETIDFKKALNKLNIREAELEKIQKQQPAAPAQEPQVAAPAATQPPQQPAPEAPQDADEDKTVAFGTQQAAQAARSAAAQPTPQPPQQTAPEADDDKTMAFGAGEPAIPAMAPQSAPAKEQSAAASSFAQAPAQGQNFDKPKRGKKIVIAAAGAAAVLIAVCLILFLPGGKKGTGKSAEEPFAPDYIYDGSSEDLILENDYLKLVMNPLTTQIVVTDKTAHTDWNFDSVTDEKWDHATLRIDFNPANAIYGEQGEVRACTYDICATEDRIDVYYAVTDRYWQKYCDEYFVPPVLTQERYETYLSAIEDEKVKKAFKDYYGKYDINNLSSKQSRNHDKDELLMSYPILETDGVCYILRGVGPVLAVKLTEELTKLGYDEAQYRQDLELAKHGLVDAYVRMRYRLDRQDMTVEVSYMYPTGDGPCSIEILPGFEQTERYVRDETAYYGCLKENASFLCMTDTSYGIRGDYSTVYNVWNATEKRIVSTYQYLTDTETVTQRYRFVASGSEDDLRSAYQGN